MYATFPGSRPLGLPGLFTRWIVGLFIALSLAMAGMAAHAAPPPAGTSISNQASATYLDASGTSQTVSSNVVQTTVQQIASLTLTANGAQSANPGGVVNYPHTLTNTGNGSDTFNLTASNTAGAFSMTGVQIFLDNGSGAPTGPAITSPVSVAAGLTYKFIVQGTLPAGATVGQTNTITVTATSVFDPTKTQSNADVTTVTNGAVVNLSKSASVSSGPAGTLIKYTLGYTNTGNATATAVAITDILPAGLTYVPGSARWSGTGATALSDSGGTAGSGPTLTSSYTLATKTLLMTLSSVGTGQSGNISFDVTVDAGTAPGILNNTATMSYNDGAGTVTGSSNTVPFTVLQTASVTMTPPAAVASAPAGTTVSFANLLTNTGNGVDSFNIAVGTHNFPPGTTFQLFQSDGSTPLSSNNTGPLAAGATYNVVLKATLPAGATGPGPFAVDKTATSALDPTKSATATDTLTAVPADADPTPCAPQDGTCEFSGVREIWYGAGSGWAVAPAANGAVCSHLIMGDPNFGVPKACYSRPYTGSWTPPPPSSEGGSVGGGDGGGGGGGGGGCRVESPGTAPGGAANPDGGTNGTTQASGGGLCVANGVPFEVPPAVTYGLTGGLGGAGGGAWAQPGEPGAAGSVVITYAALTLDKSQPSPALVVGANSVYTLTVTNTNTTGVTAYSARVVDQLPPNMTYVSSSGTGWSCSAATNAGGTLVTCDFTGTINANGGTAVLQITAKPTNHFTVTNYAAVDPTGSTSPPVPTTCTAANTPAGCAAPVVSPVPVTVSGYGYEDLNHNGARDAGEVGRVIFNNALYVKLTTRTGSVCNFPALAVAIIDTSPALGAYSFPNVAQGDYCLLMQLDNSLASNNPGYPTAFIGTENGSGVIRFTVSSGEVLPQNFGMYRGSRMTGTVFVDNGAGGGIANNGVRTGAEAGLAGITVIVKRLGVEVARTVSSGDGSFILWFSQTGGVSGTVTTVLPDGYTATGGSAGTLALGSYTRAPPTSPRWARPATWRWANW